MHSFRLASAFACLLLLHNLGFSQFQDAIVIFKDGFPLLAKVKESTTRVVDPGSGTSIPISGSLFLDDGVRTIRFSASQVKHAVELKKGDVEQLMKINRFNLTFRGRTLYLQPSYVLEDAEPWNEKWQRKIPFHGEAKGKIEQWITNLTPHSMQVITKDFLWDPKYFTSEFPPSEIKELLVSYFNSKKEMRSGEKQIQIARFFFQANCLNEAEKELAETASVESPDREGAKELLEIVMRKKANLFVEDLKKAYDLGQLQVVKQGLDRYENLDLKLVADKNRLLAFDLKSKWEGSLAQVKKAKEWLTMLSGFASKSGAWIEAAELIQAELNPDAIGRLETFLGFADQYDREKQAKKKTSQSAEQVLALAVSGWLQGNAAADPDPELAQKLLRARRFILDYLARPSPVARSEMLKKFRSLTENDLSVDVLARMVLLLPPIKPADSLGTENVTQTIEAPDAVSGSYIVKLPPDYHPLRPYPVLFLLHHGVKPEELVKKWEAQAAKFGFILVAPTDASIVVDTLRDLRRRYQIDSDRVFVFGSATGGDKALDVGLSHPDLFAGVLAMSGTFKKVTKSYSTNAQYLPFYLVDGSLNYGNPKLTLSVFKEWTSGHYPSFYFEYFGRKQEWFEGELPMMMHWMSLKKRHHPQRELGRRSEEFKTMREDDNRFYWLSTDSIADNFLIGAQKWTGRPATLSASLAVGNDLSNGKDKADIWTQFRINTTGIRQVSLWIEQGMIDHSKPVRIYFNGDRFGADRTVPADLQIMLEELYMNGDRQRLFVAKIDAKLKG